MLREQLATNGFSLVELLLAVSLFSFLMVALGGALLSGQEGQRLAGERARAVFLAEEGLEAARNIRDEDWDNFSAGSYGLAVSGGQWEFSGSSDTTEIFTRVLDLSSVDSDRWQVTSTVSWEQNPQRSGEVELTTYFTNWQDNAGGGSPTTCGDYAVGQGYSGGTCRPSAQQCTNNSETHLSSGDQYCTGGPSADTCCAAPTVTPTPSLTPTPSPSPTPTPTTCAGYCQGQDYGGGTCRQNVNRCNSRGETHESGGDTFCTGGPSADTCCCAP